MKKSIALLLAAVFVVAMLAGCKGETLSGRYSVESLFDKGQLESYDETQLARIGLHIGNIYIEFLEGGKYRRVFANEITEGTYKIKGDKITLTSTTNIKSTGTIDGNTLVLDVNNARLTLTKKS